MSRLERTLNDPKIALIAGLVAVAFNVLLYFGVFVPRMTPVVGQIYAHASSFGASLPEAVGSSGSGHHEAGSDPKDTSRTHREVVKFRPDAEGNNKPLAEARSYPGAAGIRLRSEASGGSVGGGTDGSVSGQPPESPSGTSPRASASSQPSASPQPSPPDSQSSPVPQVQYRPQ